MSIVGEQKERDVFNIGIALLRIIMCFAVVMSHFYGFDSDDPNKRVVTMYTSLAVPVFMIVSFIFVDMSVIAGDRQKFIRRMQRLIVPHVFWAFVYFFFYWVLDGVFGFRLGVPLGFKVLIAQLIAGNGLNAAAWYIVDLIIITIVIVLIYKFFEDKAFWFLVACGILALILQYSGKWFSFVNSFLYGNVLYWTVGRLLEMIPFAVLGIALHRYKVIWKLSAYFRKWGMVVFLIGLVLISVMVMIGTLSFFDIQKDFMYGGLDLILLALFLVLLFGALDFSVFPEVFKKGIMMISKCTMGIYFIHNLIGNLILQSGFNTLVGIEEGKMAVCILIFVISMVVAFLLALIPSKVLKMAVM